MRDDTPCRLTAKDVSVLEGMVDRIKAQSRPAMMRLLQRKLASARVFIRDDIDPRVATINSRIQYLVGDGPVETCVLTHGGENALPGTALPVSDLHGLALLGLMEGDAIAVEIEGGRIDVLHVVRIEHQPEAARQESRHPGFTVTADASIARRGSGLLPGEPDDDDPGPHAA